MTVSRARRISLTSFALALLVLLGGCPAKDDAQQAAKPVEPANDDAAALYAFGASLARYAGGIEVDDADVAAIQEGLGDALRNKALKYDPKALGPQLQKLITERRSAAAAKEKEAAVAFLASAAGEPGARKLDSGLVIRTLTEGTGVSPKATDRVKVHYKGTLRDGKEFDSSTSRGEPATFPLNRVVRCWTEGVQQMKVGEKAKLTCPAELGYGERGVPGRIPPGASLAFEVELLEILPETAAVVPAPKPAHDPKAAPAAKSGETKKQ